MTDISEPDRTALREWLLSVIGNQDKTNVDMSLAHRVFNYVPYCSVKLVDKKQRDPIAYITIAFTEQGKALKEILVRLFLLVGTQSLSPPPPTPAMQELRKSLQAAGAFQDRDL